MTSYGQSYYKILQKINTQYLGLHNLNNLQHIQSKLNCYKQYSSKPTEYYQCFIKIEEKRESDAKELGEYYNLIQEELKICQENNKDNDVGKCNQKFSMGIVDLYDRFYKTRVGNRKQYKKYKN